MNEDMPHRELAMWIVGSILGFTVLCIGGCWVDLHVRKSVAKFEANARVEMVQEISGAIKSFSNSGKECE